MNNNVFFFWLTCIAAIKHTLRRILVRPVQFAAKCRLAYTFIITSAFILCSFIADAQQTRLIIRADDMGITHATNNACRDAFIKGVAKSVEIMAPSPWFLEAVKYLNENPGYDVGIHLAITSEWNNLKWRPLTYAPSLTDSDGYFYPTIWNGSPDLPSLHDNHPNFAEAEKELHAQIDLVKKHLPQLSHISTHMGFDDSYPELKKIVGKLSKEYNLPITQSPDVLDFPGDETMRTDNKAAREKAFITQLPKLEKGRTYLFVLHPCYNTQEMETVVSGSYTNVATVRDADASLVMSKKVKAALKKYNIELISVKDYFEFAR